MANTGNTQSQAGNGSDARRDEDAANAQRPRSTSNRGFASMDRERQREIASLGGRAAHQRGTAHEFDSAEAREAGRKGGEAVSQNREHMARIGRKGGENSRGGNARRRTEPSTTSAASVDQIAIDQPLPSEADTENLHLKPVQTRRAVNQPATGR
jgi:general stress protein YciG